MWKKRIAHSSTFENYVSFIFHRFIPFLECFWKGLNWWLKKIFAATQKFYLYLFVGRSPTIRCPNRLADCHCLCSHRRLWCLYYFHRRHLHYQQRSNFAAASPTAVPSSNMLSTSLPTEYRNKQSNRLIYKRDLEFGTFHQLKQTHDPISSK